MDWDADNPRLAQNLVGVLSSVRDEARLRRPLSSESARDWQIRMMQELAVPDPFYVGRFRGEPGIEHCEVEIARRRGVEAGRVRDALATFDVRLRRAIALLDGLIPRSKGPTADQLGAVIDLCAWAHAEWVRIHPLANGNGRTARLFANAIAMRYGLPPFLRLRPRPGKAYGLACAAAMDGTWQPTADLFRQLYRKALEHR